MGARNFTRKELESIQSVVQEISKIVKTESEENQITVESNNSLGVSEVIITHWKGKNSVGTYRAYIDRFTDKLTFHKFWGTCSVN